MAYLGVFEAIRARLEGKSFLFVPDYPGKAQNLDMSNPQGTVFDFAAVKTLLSRTSNVVVEGVMTVPIHPHEIAGQLLERVYPSFVFDVIAIMPRYQEAVFNSGDYGGEKYSTPVAESVEDVYDNGVFVDTYARMIKRRPIEHPVDFLVEVRVHAKEHVEAALLVQYIYEQFPPRHFLRVPHKDGSFRSWDLFQTDYKDLDSREAVKTGTDLAEREYTKVFTYRVEGYLDNTDMVEFVNLIRKRSLTVEAVEES